MIPRDRSPVVGDARLQLKPHAFKAGLKIRSNVFVHCSSDCVFVAEKGMMTKQSFRSAMKRPRCGGASPEDGSGLQLSLNTSPYQRASSGEPVIGLPVVL